MIHFGYSIYFVLWFILIIWYIESFDSFYEFRYIHLHESHFSMSMYLNQRFIRTFWYIPFYDSFIYCDIFFSVILFIFLKSLRNWIVLFLRYIYLKNSFVHFDIYLIIRFVLILWYVIFDDSFSTNDIFTVMIHLFYTISYLFRFIYFIEIYSFFWFI